MFPINFNFPYRKKDGSLITMEKALDGAGADLDLVDLDDVAITDPAEGDGLIYDATAQKWENKPVDTYKTDIVNINNGYSQNNTGKLRFQKRNGVVTVIWTGGVPKVPVALTDYNIATIPSGYAPVYDTKVVGVNFNTFSDGILLQFNTNGEIHMLGYSTSTDQLVNAVIAVSYVTNS